MGLKRKADEADDASNATPVKRAKIDTLTADAAVPVDLTEDAPIDATVPPVLAAEDEPIPEIDNAPTSPKPANAPKKKGMPPTPAPSKGPLAPPARISKLNPPKPAIQEGDKTTICVTRKTKLGAYLRRCRKLFDEGHTSITLHAMGAAIPHLALLATSLPLVLPGGVLRQEVTTNTVTCVDEIEPEDEDIEGGLRKREKAGLRVVLWMREERAKQDGTKGRGKRRNGMGKPGRGGKGDVRGDAMDVS
ncbi:hypothetical protein CALVIDRAFT_542716 [Calocera viscosa TUFC12733]|uniref:Uncharacterized protein n=1 Tax=Calocera viscosa (strain TUFC12733) TaxID=1330018 RepID=A0A167GBX1_CALVF|nr:hypothetical protein CALVIDRAFT_542716 [Calocera viscosa TUFC12733]